MRRNIKDKLYQLGVPENVRLVITQDIFGKQVGSCLFEGLVDAKSDTEFAEGVEVLTRKWKGLSDQRSVQHFVAWFATYKEMPFNMDCCAPRGQWLVKLKEAIKEQDDEVDRAVLGRGKYQFCSRYKHLECDEQEWFLRMSVDQRKAHLKNGAGYIRSKAMYTQKRQETGQLDAELIVSVSTFFSIRFHAIVGCVQVTWCQYQLAYRAAFSNCTGY